MSNRQESVMKYIRNIIRNFLICTLLLQSPVKAQDNDAIEDFEDLLDMTKDIFVIRPFESPSYYVRLSLAPVITCGVNKPFYREYISYGFACSAGSEGLFVYPFIIKASYPIFSDFGIVGGADVGFSDSSFTSGLRGGLELYPFEWVGFSVTAYKKFYLLGQSESDNNTHIALGVHILW